MNRKPISERAFFELPPNKQFGTKRYIIAVDRTEKDGNSRSNPDLQRIASDFLNNATGGIFGDDPQPRRLENYDADQLRGRKPEYSFHDGAVHVTN